MIGPAGDGAEAEELVRAHRALHDVAAGDAERAFQVEWRQNLAMFDRAGTLGAYSASTSMQRSANDSLMSSQLVEETPAQPGAARRFSLRQLRSLYGAYCTNMLRMCLPGGAIVRSTLVGIVISRIGRSLGRPYLASSYARSKYLSEGPMCIVP